jgi:UDP-N-acetylmuramate dehydrogenase
MNWPKNLKSKILKKEPLKRHTTFQIGGPAEFFISPENNQELAQVVALARMNKKPLRTLGAGSNILAAERLMRGICLCLSRPFFKKISFQGDRVQAGAGCALAQLLRQCQRKGLGGMEFVAGIPGTVGGALAMNAGVKEASLSDLIENVQVMDYNGRVKDLKPKAIRFGYRSSSLDRYIILAARFRLKSANPAKIREKIEANLAKRRLKQDYTFPSAGCFFKNPAKAPAAARLIDLCGLKGKTIGKAAISRKHANFIVNLGNAKAAEVLKLAALAKKKVKAVFGVDLEEEIKIWK